MNKHQTKGVKYVDLDHNCNRRCSHYDQHHKKLQEVMAHIPGQPGKFFFEKFSKKFRQKPK